MSKVIIRSNGCYSADTVEIEYNNEINQYDWSYIHPRHLAMILEHLFGFEVEWNNEFCFPSDEE